MIKTFADRRTHELYATGKSKRVPSDVAKRASRMLEYVPLTWRFDHEYCKHRHKSKTHPPGRDAARGFSPGLWAYDFRAGKGNRCVAPVRQRTCARTPGCQSGHGVAPFATIWQHGGVLAKRAACGRSLQPKGDIPLSRSALHSFIARHRRPLERPAADARAAGACTPARVARRRCLPSLARHRARRA